MYGRKADSRRNILSTSKPYLLPFIEADRLFKCLTKNARRVDKRCEYNYKINVKNVLLNLYGKNGL
jgi:hypothetical protein